MQLQQKQVVKSGSHIQRGEKIEGGLEIMNM